MLEILVLEDKEEERSYLCDCISRVFSDGRISIADHAKEALQLVRQQEFDLFFIDVDLPGNMDGFQFAETIRNLVWTVVWQRNAHRLCRSAV